MATTEQKCANCEKTGLPILPVRYTVLPKTIAAKLPAGVTGQGVTDVALTEHYYGLRTLRAGWLYLFYVKGARGSNYWEAYNVTEDGHLWKQSLPLPAEAKTDPACAQKAIAVQMDIIAIERPEKCTEVYLAFSQHPWLKDTFDRYAGNAALRKQRMQCIEPAKWIAGGTTGQGHATAATVANIDDVIEYMPGLAPDLLQPRDKPIVDKNGVVDQSVAEHETTRYSLHVRQATPASASDALVKLMHQVGETNHGKSHPPMLLALWDGVGNVHELNGFRNDATGRLVQYYHKQSMQIDAMQAIDAAKVAISQGAVASKSRWRSALRAGWEAMLNSSPAGLDGIPTAPIEQSPEDIAASQRRIANAGKISQKEAKEIGDAAWPKYREKLDQPKLKAFRDSFDAFHAKVDSLQSKRTHDVGAWLGAPVFIHTLEDYNHHHLSDGVEYEKVIAEAVFGLGSEPEGAKLLDKLVAQIHPTKAECVFWRAMALNQVEVKTELEQILAAAETHKDTPLDTAKEGVNQLLETLEKFKKFAELYEKFNGLANQAKPTNITDKAAQLTHVDKLMASAGSAVFRWLGVKQLGDYVGEKVVHGLCLVRAGLPKADMKSLIVEEAKRDGKLRTELMNRLRQLRASGMAADAAFFQSAQELAATEGSKSMRAKWAEVLSGKEAVEATTGMRVAVVVLLIEAAGFAKILAKSDKTDADYASLYASGLSVVGATLNLALPLKSIFGNASQSANALKALGGFAGGAAACITAVTDIQTAADAAHRKNGAETTFLILKVTLGGLGAFANFATALSSSAPLIERLAGRKGYVIFLEKVGTGISDAAARRAALAAGEAVAELAGERAVMMGFGRAILYLAGWEVAVAITLVQILVWYFSDDDLQIWFSKCAFGISPANNPAWTVEKQDQEFAKALEKVGLSTQKEAE